VKLSVHLLLHGASAQRHALALEIFSSGRTNSLYSGVIEPTLDSNGIKAAAHIFCGTQALQPVFSPELSFEHRMSWK
jgi:hypothetical protein